MMGRTLRPEDLIDLLILKANQAEDQVGDYATALDVLSRARDIPSGRAQMALLSIWRRVYIRDNWAALSTNNLTDQQLEEILRETALFNTLSILRGSSSHRRVSTCSLLADFPLLAFFQTSHLRRFLSLPRTSSYQPRTHRHRNWPHGAQMTAPTRSVVSGKTC